MKEKTHSANNKTTSFSCEISVSGKQNHQFYLFIYLKWKTGKKPGRRTAPPFCREREMENAICGRLALSPNHVFNSKSGISISPSLSFYVYNEYAIVVTVDVCFSNSVFDGFQYAQSQSSMFISNVDLIRALTKCSMLCVQYFRFIAPHILKL